MSSLGFAGTHWVSSRHAAAQRLKTIAAVIAHQNSGALSFNDSEAAQESLSVLETIPNIVWGGIYDTQGVRLAHFQRDEALPPPNVYSSQMTFENPRLVSVEPVNWKGEPLGWVVVRADNSDFYRQMSRFALVASCILLVTMVTGWLVATRLQRVISRPIKTLARAAAKVSEEKDYSVRVESVAKDETGLLFEAFNDMLSQIEASSEQLAKARDEALEASNTKSMFLANMSHEIRTPMNGVIGMTRLTLDTELTDVQREYLTMVSESADALLAIINDILDFSKIEAGLLELDPHSFEFRSVVDQVMKSLAVKAHQKNLELMSEVSPDVPNDLTLDSTRLRQIIINLVGNAIKFTAQGEVALRVDVESRDEGKVVLHLQIRDTGIGIPEEKQQAIFDSFAQADASTTREFGGTGLGLSITSYLVALMNGKIWVESKIGKGSIFHVTLEGQVNEDQTTKLTYDDSIQGRTALVVDDNKTNRRLLEVLLKRWGMQPTMADSGEQALEIVQEVDQPFDFLLLDVNMPGMDGFEVAQKLGIDCPVTLMLSSSDLSSDTAKCRKLGIEHYMTKPVGESELGNALRKLVGNEKIVRRQQQKRKEELTKGLRGLRVLLAEDNPINQALAVALLEQMGIVVTVVDNGLLALEAAQKSDFDFVLMDVQMPEMDGFQATQAIRKLPPPVGNLPIIALTAHAIKGDRERCLEAGMDEYVTKPIDPKNLRDTILGLKLTPPEPVESLDAEQAVSSLAPVVESEGPPKGGRALTIDQAGVLKRAGGSEAVLELVKAELLKQLPLSLEKLAQAVEKGEKAELKSISHSFRGMVANFGVPELTEPLGQLEDLDPSEEPTRAEELFQNVKALTAELRRRL